MARTRPLGRKKSDHRVCQAERFIRAGEFRARIHISPEKQESVFFSVNQPIIAEAPRRRKHKNSKQSNKEASSRGGYPDIENKRSVNGKPTHRVPGRQGKKVSKEAAGENPSLSSWKSWYAFKKKNSGTHNC
jgi:hypothetical protein